jgi:hypothetical protein
MTRKKAWEFNEPTDDWFYMYKKQFTGWVITIYVFMCALTFKFNIAFFSFFFDQAPFQARFENAKYYRKMLTWYLITGIVCMDLALIIIDITCLTMIEDNNQLFITVIETLVLSFISLIMTGTLLCLLKRSLEYTEPKRDKLKLKKMPDDSDSWEDYANLDKKFDKEKMTERRLLMGDLLKHVKHNKLLFLNNKLDELLNAFGNRKCKSMLDLGTGWPLEDDPRLAITWPCSPALCEDYTE